MGMPGHSRCTIPTTSRVASGVKTPLASSIMMASISPWESLMARAFFVQWAASWAGLLAYMSEVMTWAPSSLHDPGEEVEALGVDLVVADPEAAAAVGHRAADPEGDDVQRGVDVERGEAGGHVRPADVGARHGLLQEADALPGVLAVVARLDHEAVAAHGGDGLVAHVVHGRRDGRDHVGAHQETPEALLRVADGLVDHADRLAHAPPLPPRLRPPTRRSRRRPARGRYRHTPPSEISTWPVMKLDASEAR